MNTFSSINYGNDWGIFVDIENPNIIINIVQHDKKEQHYKKERKININNSSILVLTLKILNTIVTLLICGLLFYFIYFII
jgi:hypothetical protein